LPPKDPPAPLPRLLADRPQPVWRRRVECDRAALPELVLLETDLHPHPPPRDVAVLATAVRHERIRRTRLTADGIDDVEDPDVAVGVASEPLPSDAGREVDDTARLRRL